MVTLEKYYNDGDEASRSITATSDGRDYTVGIMYDTDVGDCFVVKIRGAAEFKKFAASLVDLLTGMIEDIEDLEAK